MLFRSAVGAFNSGIILVASHVDDLINFGAEFGYVGWPINLVDFVAEDGLIGDGVAALEVAADDAIHHASRGGQGHFKRPQERNHRLFLCGSTCDEASGATIPEIATYHGYRAIRIELAVQRRTVGCIAIRLDIAECNGIECGRFFVV